MDKIEPFRRNSGPPILKLQKKSDMEILRNAIVVNVVKLCKYLHRQGKTALNLVTFETYLVLTLRPAEFFYRRLPVML